MDLEAVLFRTRVEMKKTATSCYSCVIQERWESEVEWGMSEEQSESNRIVWFPITLINCESLKALEANITAVRSPSNAQKCTHMRIKMLPTCQSQLVHWKSWILWIYSSRRSWFSSHNLSLIKCGCPAIAALLPGLIRFFFSSFFLAPIRFRIIKFWMSVDT